MLGEARGWKLDIAQDLVEATQGFGRIWKSFMLASTGWKGSIDGNFDIDDSTVFAAANRPSGAVLSGTSYGAVRMYIYPSANHPLRYYYGKIWLNLTVTATLTGVVRYSGTFTGQDEFAAN